MLLAELNLRHTRRHMPTRRVALEPSFLPTTGPAHGLALLAGVVEEFAAALDGEWTDLYRRLLHDARTGLAVPSIALRHRLQTDVHGLDRSRHRLVGEDGRIVLELDVHGAPMPQLLGVALAAAALPPVARVAVVRGVLDVLDGRRTIAPGVRIRRLDHGHPALRPPPAGVRFRPGGPADERPWAGVPPARRWALEVLGMTPATALTRAEVNRRYRRLLRDAHPDHGGAGDAAAQRIAELAQARVLLLDDVAEQPGGEERVDDDGVVAASSAPGGDH